MINILYIDPSIMTYTIQIITGIIVVAGSGIGIVFKKIKKNNKWKNKKNKIESDDIKMK